jgi:hypothetical protein
MAAFTPHENLLQILGVCKDPLLILMPYIERGSLYDLLKQAQIDNARAVTIAQGIARGKNATLVSAHGRQAWRICTSTR